MIEDLTVGTGATGFRSGAIGKIGVTLDCATAREERVLRAAARAQPATGAPLLTHASLYPVGLVQFAPLEGEGAELRRVVIGHGDTCLDPEYHDAVLKTGRLLAFATIGREHSNPDVERAVALVRLPWAGWGGRLPRSSDRCHRSDSRAFGGMGFGHACTGFVDRSRGPGVSKGELDQLTIDNARWSVAW